MSELIRKYIWLIRLLSSAGMRGLSLREIQSGWERSWGESYSRRTFNNHREALEEIFGLRIDCDRSSNRYYLRFPGEATDADKEAAWMIDTFTVGNLLTLGKERLSGRVSVEEIPSGRRWLTSIMEAMTDDKFLEIGYMKYGDAKAENLNVAPYAVKEKGKRWYLIAWCRERNGLRLYGLDRIKSLKVSDVRFSMPHGFDVEELFAENYGMYFSEGRKTERILLRAVSKRQADYLRDLPLHRSQRELPGGLFELRLIPDDDFFMELCRFSGKIEVLEPLSLRRRLRETGKQVYTLYEKDYFAGS